MKDLAPFVKHYLICALFAGLDDETALDDKYSLKDIDDAAVQQAIADCTKFQEENAEDLKVFQEAYDEEEAGHCFLLDRNGHGAGFQDRDVEPQVDRLAAAAVKFGEVNFYAYADKVGC